MGSSFLNMEDVNKYQGYLKYRGKCRERALAFIAKNEDKALRLVRGTYTCSFWGDFLHWWAEDAYAVVYDPSADQFPSNGEGEYKEHGVVMGRCNECGDKVLEEDMGGEDGARMQGGFFLCSDACAAKFDGVLKHNFVRKLEE